MATTYAGVCSFDGTTFTCYSEKHGLRNINTHSILQDATGQRWFGTGGGVYRFDGKTFTNFTRADALRGLQIGA
ncbi:MAG TPA: hypothetical protein VHL57_01790, partial [Flavobacteriales bacterium]|nr:hypothetical protein [Flavobacteriales bacterium]